MPPTSTVIFGRRQRHELRLVDEHHFRRNADVLFEVVAESVGSRFEHGECLDVGLLLRCVGASGRERHGDVEAGVLRGLLDAGASGEHDQIGQRDLLAVLIARR